MTSCDLVSQRKKKKNESKRERTARGQREKATPSMSVTEEEANWITENVFEGSHELYDTFVRDPSMMRVADLKNVLKFFRDVGQRRVSLQGNKAELVLRIQDVYNSHHHRPRPAPDRSPQPQQQPATATATAAHHR
jgi:hypothetical protein